MIPILSIFLAAAVSLFPDDTAALRRFLARYRGGSIDASVIGRIMPSVEPPPAFPAFERARAKMRLHPTPRAAALLLDAAVITLANDPREELAHFAAQQPWVIRRRALDELREYYTGEAVQDWALEQCAEPALSTARRRVLVEYLGAALAQRPRPRVYTFLLHSIGHSDGTVRAAALAALAPALRPEHLMLVVRGLYDREAAVRLRAVQALRVALPRLEPDLDEAQRARLAQLMAARLEDGDPQVRVLLAELLRDHAHPAAIPLLVAALGAEERRAGTAAARLRLRVALEDLLHGLTGRGAPPLSSAQWRAWLAHAKRAATSESDPTAKRTVSTPIHRTWSRYFGREVRSDHVIFILDFSGSMRRRAGTRAHDEGTGHRDRRSRIAIARREFLRYLQSIDSLHRFNVVVFAVGSRAAFDALVPATEENKDRARAFVNSIALGGETNLLSGIVRGLRCAGLDGGERFGTRADTVYLLSDGIPTAGAVTDPGDITRIVTRMNQSSGLTINVVDLGARHSAFQKHLRSLALQNGGEYIRP